MSSGDIFYFPSHPKEMRFLLLVSPSLPRNFLPKISYGKGSSELTCVGFYIPPSGSLEPSVQKKVLILSFVRRLENGAGLMGGRDSVGGVGGGIVLDQIGEKKGGMERGKMGKRNTKAGGMTGEKGGAKALMRVSKQRHQGGGGLTSARWEG